MSKLPMRVTDNAEIGYGGIFCNKKYQILIVENDIIKEPHFHIIDCKTMGEKFHSRILFRKAKYMKGETTKLTKREINSLIRHFKSINKLTSFNCKNWFIMVWLWNRSNNSKAYYKKMPDYTKLK